MKDAGLLKRALLIWTVFGSFETLQAWALQPSRGLDERSLSLAFVRNMPWWWAWAALTPIILWSVRRFPLRQPWLLRHLATHACIGIGVTMAHLLLAGRVLFWFAPPNPRVVTWLDMSRDFANGYLALDVMTYWAVVALFHAFISHRALTDTIVDRARMAARTSQLERDVSMARLDALRMELNPHFLFNTLNSVAGLVRTGQRDGAIDMLAQLGDLLRFTLGSAHAPMTSVRDEMDFLSRYLAIEAVRFRDRLTVQYDIDPGVEQAAIPTLILQPLVENAVRHGIARAPGGGRLEVTAALEGTTLRLGVTNQSDDGPSGRIVREGVGLTNTRQRLSEMYATGASLDAQAIPHGFRVTVRLPFAPFILEPHAA